LKPRLLRRKKSTAVERKRERLDSGGGSFIGEGVSHVIKNGPNTIAEEEEIEKTFCLKLTDMSNKIKKGFKNVIMPHENDKNTEEEQLEAPSLKRFVSEASGSQKANLFGSKDPMLCDLAEEKAFDKYCNFFDYDHSNLQDAAKLRKYIDYDGKINDSDIKDMKESFKIYLNLKNYKDENPLAADIAAAVDVSLSLHTDFFDAIKSPHHHNHENNQIHLAEVHAELENNKEPEPELNRIRPSERVKILEDLMSKSFPRIKGTKVSKV